MVPGRRLVPEPHPRRTDPARGRRERHLRSFDRLSGDRDPLRGDRLRRRDGGNRRCVFLDGHHADVGGADDRGARLDRAGAGRVRRLARRSAAARRLFLRDPDDARALRQGLRLFVPARRSSGPRCPTSWRSSCSPSCRPATSPAARRRPASAGHSCPTANETCKIKENDMSYLYTTQFHEDRGCRTGHAGARSRRLRRRAAQGRLHLPRADRRLRLDLGAQQGPPGDGRGAQGPGRRRLRREREGGRERHSDPQGSRAAGQQAHLHDLLRLHGPDGRGRQAVPGREVRALHRLQARRQSRHLQFPLPSGPRGRGHDRRP